MTTLAKLLAKLLRNCIWALRMEDEEHYRQNGFRIFIAEDNLDEAAKDLASYNEEVYEDEESNTTLQLNCTDFTTMFTSAQQESVINNVSQAVQNAFNFTAGKMSASKDQLAIIYNEEDETSTWQYTTETNAHHFTREKVIAIIKMVVSNAIYMCAGQSYSQNGLAIGGDASSELANLFLAQVERDKFLRMAAAGANMHRGSPIWKLCKRYMDDMVS